MKYKFTLIMVLLAFVSLFSQNRYSSIRGKVTDHSTGQPLAGVNVTLLDTPWGASTGINGEYVITGVPEGRYQLRGTLVGYEAYIHPDVTINSIRSEVVNFDLMQKDIKIGEVTVSSGYFEKEPSLVSSVTSFNNEEIRRAPGGFEDVIRALSVLPGIAQADAGRNDLIVRGGAPSENLYIIDGIPVPSINHFGSQGSTGGPLSFVDLNFVDKVSFSTGGFPVSYGGKISSVLDISLMEGRMDRIGGRATISATQFGINAEGPLNDKLNFLLSARRSYLDFIFKAAGFGFVPEYYDVLTKVGYSPSKDDMISFIFISAFDKVKFNNNTTENRYENSRTLGNDQLQYVSAFNYRRLLNKGFFNISVNRNYVDYNFYQRDTLMNPIFLNNSLEEENGLITELVYKPSVTSEFTIGANAKLIEFNSDIKLPFFRTTFGDSLSVNNLSAFKNYKKAGVYAQHSFRPSAFLTAVSGLRLDYFDGIKNSYSVSPRLSLSIFPDEVSVIKISAGLYTQDPSYIWLAGDPINRNLKSIKAKNFIISFERALREDTQIKIEGFLKYYQNYPVSILRPYLILSNTGAGFGGPEDNYSSFALERLTSRGEGNVRGIEMQVQKRSSGLPLYGIFSFTLSRSEFRALDNIKRPGSFDQNLILNLSGGYIFNKKWEAAVKFRLATGRPYTPYNQDGTQQRELYNTARLEPSHSLDVRVDRRFYFEKWALVAYLDIQNVYNRKNISSVEWDYRSMSIKEADGIGILPSIGISAEF